MAAKKNTQEGYAFLVSELKKDKKAVYADLKAKADKKSLAVYPIMYGRAKAALGMVASGKPGRKKAIATGVRRGPGRPRKNSGVIGGGLDSVLGILQEAERNQAALRGTLERIRELIDQVV